MDQYRKTIEESEGMKRGMISYLKGVVEQVNENSIVLENGGIGYEIFVPTSLAMTLSTGGEVIKLHTYFNVREDAMQLYGFLSAEDLSMFKLLIGVNGVGPKVGLGILSGLSTDEIRFAVLSDDVKTIMKAPGIGKKTAAKLILELKDKFDLEEVIQQKGINQDVISGMPGVGEAKNEAIMALTALGYSNSDALKAVGRVELTPNMDVEMILKTALKYMT